MAADARVLLRSLLVLLRKLVQADSAGRIRTFVGTVGVVGGAATPGIAPVTPRFLDHLTSSHGVADDRAVRRCCRNIRRAEEPDGGARKHRNHDRSHICILLGLLPILKWHLLLTTSAGIIPLLLRFAGPTVSLPVPGDSSAPAPTGAIRALRRD